MTGNYLMTCMVCGENKVDQGLQGLLCYGCGSLFRPIMHDAGYGVKVPMTDDELRKHYRSKLALLQLGECVWESSNLIEKEHEIRNILDELGAQ